MNDYILIKLSERIVNSFVPIISGHKWVFRARVTISPKEFIDFLYNKCPVKIKPPSDGINVFELHFPLGTAEYTPSYPEYGITTYHDRVEVVYADEIDYL